MSHENDERTRLAGATPLPVPSHGAYLGADQIAKSKKYGNFRCLVRLFQSSLRLPAFVSDSDGFKSAVRMRPHPLAAGSTTHRTFSALAHVLKSGGQLYEIPLHSRYS
jgi:hypothetical protein